MSWNLHIPRLVIVLAVSVIAVLLILGMPHPPAQASPPEADAPHALPADGLKATGAYTAYLPLAMCPYPAGCMTHVTDDFSNPASGWPVGSGRYVTSAYDQGVYKVSETMMGDPLFYAVSPDWMVPDVATVEVDAWLENPAPKDIGFSAHVSLVFGLQLFPWSGENLWARWYEFSVHPDSQFYHVWKWSHDTPTTLANGTSSAIVRDYGAAQRLKVVRDGSTFDLYVNDVYVTTITDAFDPLVGRGSIGLGGGSTGRVLFDNFEISASGCITMPVTGSATAR